MKILIIEDEYNLAEIISDSLKKEQYSTDISQDGEEGLYLAENNEYDLIILDVMLPNLNGFEILKKIREKGVASKIIMLTARSTLEDKLEGLENGANDYLVKPIHIEELIARVNILLKGINNNSSIITYQDLELNTKTLKIKSKNTNQEVFLVRKEFQLLEYFITNKELILNKEQIYDRIWGIEKDIESNNLEAYLSFIRRKLKAIGSNVKIKSVRGIGYKMETCDE